MHSETILEIEYKEDATKYWLKIYLKYVNSNSNSASWVDWDGQDMSYARMMICPGEFFSVSQEESAPEGDPDCFEKIEWRKM